MYLPLLLRLKLCGVLTLTAKTAGVGFTVTDDAANATGTGAVDHVSADATTTANATIATVTEVETVTFDTTKAIDAGDVFTMKIKLDTGELILPLNMWLSLVNLLPQISLMLLLL